MGRAKIKKKSTFIDMTAMSDVTVLLLTFFMLTSTFVKKEPVQSNDSRLCIEINIPETNVLRYWSIRAESIYESGQAVRLARSAGSYGEENGVTFTPREAKNSCRRLPLCADEEYERNTSTRRRPARCCIEE